jgi:hypothetical protein
MCKNRSYLCLFSKRLFLFFLGVQLRQGHSGAGLEVIRGFRRRVRPRGGGAGYFLMVTGNHDNHPAMREMLEKSMGKKLCRHYEIGERNLVNRIYIV